MLQASSPKQYYRISATEAILSQLNAGEAVPLPYDLVVKIKPSYGLVVANWDESELIGEVVALCLIKSVDLKSSTASVDSAWATITLKPNPSGRRWWRTQFFNFAESVVERYMLNDLFAEHFPQYSDIDFGRITGALPEGYRRGQGQDIPGYVYVIKSQYGYKIGKTVNLKERTRLFEVKLPFPIEVVHSTYFDDYTAAESFFHRMFASKRLEGEWFNLNNDDLEVIKNIKDISSLN
jgi:hypothetical protein